MADKKKPEKPNLKRFLREKPPERKAAAPVRQPPKRSISKTGSKSELEVAHDTGQRVRDPGPRAPDTGNRTLETDDELAGLADRDTDSGQRDDIAPVQRPIAPPTTPRPEPELVQEEPAGKDWSAAIGDWASGVYRKIKKPLIILVSLAVLGIGAKVAYDYNEEYKAEQAAAEAKRKKKMAIAQAKMKRRKRVKELYLKLRRCDDINLLKQMCLDQKSVDLKKNSAELFAQANEFVKAGIIYAQLGIVDKVSDMIRKCEETGDKKGAETIRKEMRILLDARKLALDDLRERERKEMEDRKKRMKARIASLVQVLKQCDDRTRLSRMCLTPEQENLKKQSAVSFIELKAYEKAGIIYAKMGLLREATNMIKICEREGNQKGARRIRTELKITAEALNTAVDTRKDTGAGTQRTERSEAPGVEGTVRKPKETGRTTPKKDSVEDIRIE